MIQEYSVLAIGFAAQGLFGLRLLVQLWFAERNRTIEAPALFWQLSLAASILFLVYGLARTDLVIIVGQLITYYIYIRNLSVQGNWATVPAPIRILISLIPVIAVIAYLLFGNFDALKTVPLTNPMLLIGFLGQLLLNLRFVYQWIYVERNKNSVLPKGFWLISVGGSLLILLYAFNHPTHGYDLVLILAQSMGLVVYLRNLFIIGSLKTS